MKARPLRSAAPAEATPRRLLIPINASADTRWGIDYAVRRHRTGIALEVVLLTIDEPVADGQALRFPTQQELANFQSERAQSLIAEASRSLTKENIPWRGVFKQGEVTFSILDAAEEFDCHEIVMPAPKKGLSSIFADHTVSAVREQQRDIPVVVVGHEGIPV